MKSIIISGFLFLIALNCFSQSVAIVNKELLEENFMSRVKTLDEFMARFNGLEYSPIVNQHDTLQRQKNILSLFDYNVLTKADSTTAGQIMTFVNDVNRNNLTLRFKDSLWFAETTCEFYYQNIKHTLKIILKTEEVRHGIFGWSIVGANGLVEAGLLNESIKYSISPVEHEVSFVEMIGMLNNVANNAVGLRARDVKIDNLSFLFGLIHEKQIKFVQCIDITYHFFNIPGYYFSVREYNEDDTHSGWLISDIRSIPNNNIAATMQNIMYKRM